MNFKHIPIIISCLGCSLTLNSATQHDTQSWLNVTVTGNIDKQSKALNRFKYWLENQERIGDDSSRLSQALLRAGIGYAIKTNLSLWVGYAWIHTGAPNTTRPFNEDRIWEQLLWTTKMQQLMVTSRTRMEQRFLANNHKVAYRARQLLKLALPLECLPKFSIVGSDELFWHKNNFIGRNGQGFDQNRFFIGMGYKFNDQMTTEIGYMNQYVKRFGVPDFQANILSINFYANF